MKLRFVSAAVLTVVSAIAAVPAAAAAPNVRFGIIWYDPHGSDTPITNAKLNGEYVVIRNPRATAVQLEGFRVRDADGHVYTFGRLRLGPGKAVRLHTGEGTNTRTDRYWGQDNYVWDNDGDTARLRNAAGVLIDTCAWTDSNASSVACLP
jgi:Lamin Tail Domain